MTDSQCSLRQRWHAMIERGEERIIGCPGQMATVAPFKQDREFPDGERHIKRNMLYLPTCALGIARDELFACGKAWQS